MTTSFLLSFLHDNPGDLVSHLNWRQKTGELLIFVINLLTHNVLQLWPQNKLVVV